MFSYVAGDSSNQQGYNQVYNIPVETLDSFETFECFTEGSVESFEDELKVKTEPDLEITSSNLSLNDLYGETESCFKEDSDIVVESENLCVREDKMCLPLSDVNGIESAINKTSQPLLNLVPLQIKKEKVAVNQPSSIQKRQPVTGKLLKCDLCTYTSKYIQAIGKHKKKMHKFKGRCSVKFLAKKNCMIGNCKTSLYKCDYCTFTAKHIQQIGIHKKQMHKAKGKAEEQGDPSTSFPVEDSEINSDIAETEDAKYSCANDPWIDMTSEGEPDYDRANVKIPETSIGLFQCDICPYTSKYRNLMLGHKNIHHRPGLNFKIKSVPVYIYKCDNCFFTTKSKAMIYKHKLQHKSNEKCRQLFRCNQCSFTSQNSVNIGKHKRQVHNVTEKVTKGILNRKKCLKENKEEIMQCEYCSFTARNIQNLRIHYKDKHKEDSSLEFATSCSYRHNEAFGLLEERTRKGKQVSSKKTEGNEDIAGDSTSKENGNKRCIKEKKMKNLLINAAKGLCIPFETEAGFAASEMEEDAEKAANPSPDRAVINEPKVQLLQPLIQLVPLQLETDSLENGSSVHQSAFTHLEKRKVKVVSKVDSARAKEKHNCIILQRDLPLDSSHHGRVLRKHHLLGLADGETTRERLKKNGSSKGKLRSSEGRIFKCNLCPYTSITSQIMGQHKRRDHGIVGFRSRGWKIGRSTDGFDRSSGINTNTEITDQEHTGNQETICKEQLTLTLKSENAVLTHKSRKHSIPKSGTTRTVTGESYETTEINNSHAEIRNLSVSVFNTLGTIHTTRQSKKLNKGDLRRRVVRHKIDDANSVTMVREACDGLVENNTSGAKLCEKCDSPYEANKHTCLLKCGVNSKHNEVSVTHKSEYHESVVNPKKQSVTAKLFKCDMCPYTSQHIQAIGQHKKRKHNFIGRCSEKFLAQKKCIIGNTKRGLFKCEYCPFTAKYIQHIGSHKKQMHKDQEKIEGCVGLDKDLEKNHDVETQEGQDKREDNSWVNIVEDIVARVDLGDDDHRPKGKMGIEKIDGSFQCDLCPYTSKYRNVILRHKQRHHGPGLNLKKKPVPANIYKCDVCFFTSKSKSMIYKHKRQHKPDTECRKLFKCDQCSYTSLSSLNVAKHKRQVHTVTENVTKEILIRKKRVTDTKNKNREKLFEKKGVKTINIGGLVTYVCGCRKVYEREDSLISHLRYHCSKEPRISCYLCNYKTHRTCEVMRHLRRVHHLKIPSKRHITSQVP